MKKHSSKNIHFQKKDLFFTCVKAAFLILLLYPFLGKFSLLSEMKKTTDPHKEKLAQVSQTMGHLLGKTVAELPISFELQEVIKGLKDSAEGKKAPLTEQEWQDELKSLHEELSEKVLADTQAFFEKNSHDPDIKEMIPGKLQYKILLNGEGEESIQPYYRPTIRYCGYLQDGKEFLPTQDVVFQLDEAMPGLEQGICGMKKGEKRIIYIHPELTFQKNDPTLENGAALVFEVEVLDINSKEKHASPLEELISGENRDLSEESLEIK